MFMGSYRFVGDPETLLPAYDRLMASTPADSIDLHICVVEGGGITLFDACPSQEIFEAFSGGEDFRAALTEAGLPEPAVQPLGDVYLARLSRPVSP